ncbi:MAG: hypothetical protein AAB681_00985 [Patescibacteria group bacterium]
MAVEFKKFEEFIGSKVTQTIQGCQTFVFVSKVKHCKDLGNGKVYVEHSNPYSLQTGEYCNDPREDWFRIDLNEATLSENDTVISCNLVSESFLFVKKSSPMYQFTTSIEGMDY